MKVSELEQELACNQDHSGAMEVITLLSISTSLPIFRGSCTSIAFWVILNFLLRILAAMIHMQKLLEVMEDMKIEWNDKLRLVLLYALR